MAQHKWAKEIKAWADGAEIEGRYKDRNGYSEWKALNVTYWEDSQWEYRIKPQPKEPQYLYVYKSIPYQDGSSTSEVRIATVKLNNDYYIGKIKLEVDD